MSLEAYGQSQWFSIGPEGGWIDHIVFHPDNPDVMYLGGDVYGGFYRSVDAGNSWQRVESFGSVNAWTLAVHPTSPNIIYAGSIMDNNMGIMKSSDSGMTWATILKWPDIATIAIDPTNPDVIYAGAGFWEDYQEQGHGEGIYKSEDGGESWVKAGLDTFNVQSIVIRPDSPNIIYAAVYRGDLAAEPPTPAGVYQSMDSGNTWSRIALADQDVWKLAICPDSVNIMFAATWDRLYKSVDYGLNWRPVPIASMFFLALDIAPSDGNVIYTGSIIDGVFKSIDRGQTWTNISADMPAKRIWTLSVHPNDVDIVFVGQAGQGILKTMDGGVSWRSVNTGFKCHYAFDIDVDQNSNLYIGIYNEEDNKLTSIKRWNDVSGWKDLGTTDEMVKTIVVDPTNSQTIYSTSLNHFYNIFPGGSLYRTDNAGITWTSIGSGLPDSTYIESLAIDPVNSNILYAGTSSGLGYIGGKGIYKSTDKGHNWFLTGPDSLMASSIVIHPDSSNIIYAGTLNNIYKSVDRGGSWQPLGLPGLPLLSLAIDPSNPITIYAGIFTAGIFKSSDGGNNWQQVGLHGKSVTGIVIDPLHTQTIYAGGSENVLPGWGVFRSTDGSNSWDDFSEGLINKEVSRLTIDPATGILYAATLGYGVYKRQLNMPPTGIEEEISGEDLTDNFSIYQNYPNPFNPATTIRYNLKEDTKVILKIYNLLGREVKTLVDEKQSAGLKTVIWDGKNNDEEPVPSGVYIYRIIANEIIKSHKMILLR